MSFAEIFSILGSCIFAFANIFYVRDTLKARIKPSIATFGIFSLVNASQLISLSVKHVWHVVPFTAVGLAVSLIIFLIALKERRFYFKLADKIALVGALIAFAAWFITKDAAYNLYIINVVTTLAFVPLIIKAFKEPTLETRFPWQANLLASTCLLLTITGAAPYIWIVPVRQFICSLLINIGLVRPLLAKTGRR